MAHIVVDVEQAKIITESLQGVEVRDPQGRSLGYVARPVTDDDIALALRRRDSDQPRYSTEHVLDRLRSLEQK